jgi:hypothetical protein
MIRCSRVKSHVLLQVMAARFDWYLKRAADPFRPFHSSMISRCGILKATSAANLSILAIVAWFAFGANNCEVSVSDVRLVHCQEGLQEEKNDPASIRNDAEKFSSVRLAMAAVRLKAVLVAEDRVSLYSGIIRE